MSRFSPEQPWPTAQDVENYLYDYRTEEITILKLLKRHYGIDLFAYQKQRVVRCEHSFEKQYMALGYDSDKSLKMYIYQPEQNRVLFLTNTPLFKLVEFLKHLLSEKEAQALDISFAHGTRSLITEKFSEIFEVPFSEACFAVNALEEKNTGMIRQIVNLKSKN